MILDQLVTNGERHRLRPVMNAELAQDVLDVLAHGPGAYEELLRDLGLVKSFDEEREDGARTPQKGQWKASTR